MVGRVLEKKGRTTAVGCGRKFQKDDGKPPLFDQQVSDRHAAALAKSVEDAGFSIQSLHQLRNRRMAYLIDIARMSVRQYETSGYSGKAIKEIKRVLAEHSLKPGMRLSQSDLDNVEREMKRGQKASLGKSNAYIRVSRDGTMETNLSPEALRTVIRIAKKELAELREDLQPHKIKVVGELIDLFAEK